MTTYKISGYNYGSTNGQAPVGFVFVTGQMTKKEAVEAGREMLGCYKALGHKVSDVPACREMTNRLYPNNRILDLDM